MIMRKLFKILIVFGVLCLLASCKSKNNESKTQNNQNHLKRVWMLVEFQNFSKGDLIKNEAQINLTNLENPAAHLGCNSISFLLESKGNKIKFSNITTTKMLCEGKMNLELAFLQSFQEYISYEIEGPKLILKNAKSEKMIFVAQDWD
jgi:heat shock protein HslJ